jgi:hypothetical protein
MVSANKIGATKHLKVLDFMVRLVVRDGISLAWLFLNALIAYSPVLSCKARRLVSDEQRACRGLVRRRAGCNAMLTSDLFAPLGYSLPGSE